MLSEQAPLFSINIEIVNRFKEFQRLWLVDIVNDDAKLNSLIQPIQCVNLFIGVTHQVLVVELVKVL